MSAWIVEHKHIDLLVYALFKYEIIGSPAQGTSEEIGQLLWRENVRSVNYCYGTRTRIPSYTFQYHGDLDDRMRDPIALHKAVECYRYQSCERPDWLKSKANTLTALLQEACCTRVHLTSEQMFDHPWWDKAPWSIGEERENHN
jgi:hypothetical protein